MLPLRSPLQEVLTAQPAVLIGLIANLVGTPLQADIVRQPVEALFQHCFERLAYYKAPGWVHIVDRLATTGTQKIQKHANFGPGVDPRSVPGIVDLRLRKRRTG
jgi:hypothetical protein